MESVTGHVDTVADGDWAAKLDATDLTSDRFCPPLPASLSQELSGKRHASSSRLFPPPPSDLLQVPRLSVWNFGLAVITTSAKLKAAVD